MDHDQRLKLLIQMMLSECVLLALPAWWSRFDFTTVEWLQQEVFMDPPQGETRAVDLVAKLKLKQSVTADGAEHWLTLIHVEVEAKDRAAPLRKRMFEYRNALRTRHALPVLPIALFLKVAQGGIGWDEYEEHYWEERIEHFRFAYVGLPGLDAAIQVQSDNLLAVALSGLMRAPDDQRALLKADAMQKAATSEKDEYVRTLMCECIDAYTELHEPHLAQYRQLLLTPKYKEANVVMQTSYERGVEETTRRMRATVVKFLEHKFKVVSAEARERLNAYNAEQLEQLSGRIAEAQSLRDLGLEDGASS